MDQIEVSMRGTINPWHWSERVFSICAPHGVVAVSRKGHPEEWCHRCLHVTHVQLWPHYDRSHLHVHFNSMEAKLTLRVCGTEVRREVLAAAEETPTVSREPRFTQRGCSQHHPHAWMLRFASFECLERTVTLLKTISVGDFVEGGNTTHDDAGVKGADGSCAVVATAVVADTKGAAAATATASTSVPSAAVSGGTPTHVSPRDEAPVVVEAVRSALLRASVVDGDVAGDLESIRAEWEHMRSGEHSFEQI